MRDRLAELGVQVEFGTELTAFTQDADGVTATLGDGAVVRSAVLVGADGGRSGVRKTLGIPFEGSTDESMHMLLGDVRVDGLDHGAGYWFADEQELSRGMALSPLPGGDLFQFAATTTVTGDAAAGVQAAFDEFCRVPGARLRELAWSTTWRPNARLARRFRDGRVFLAGDAAHVHPPTGGQGLNTGVQDAYNLGWKLGDALGDDGLLDPAEPLLDSYQAERLPVAARALGISNDLLRRHIDGAEDAYQRGDETRQLDIGYRGSPIVHDGHAGAGRLRAGDRAPDAPVVDAHGRPVRLFELFRGPHATLLVFGDTGGIPASGVPGHAVLPAGSAATGTAVVDAGGHARAAYDVPEGTAVLVRPDGHVGRIEQVTEQVTERLTVPAGASPR